MKKKDINSETDFTDLQPKQFIHYMFSEYLELKDLYIYPEPRRRRHKYDSVSSLAKAIVRALTFIETIRAVPTLSYIAMLCKFSDDQAFTNYKKYGDDYAALIKATKSYCKVRLEQLLMTQSFKGAQFILSNCHGTTNKTEQTNIERNYKIDIGGLEEDEKEEE